MKKPTLLLAATAGAIILPNGLRAQETTAYTYDALGRLVQTTVSGGTTSGRSTAVGYDPAGNRCTYVVSGVAGAPARDVAAGNPLSRIEREAQNTVDFYLGGGAGHNVPAINQLVSAAQSMLSVLTSNAPIRPTDQPDGTSLATTRGGSRSPIPTVLRPGYFGASGITRRERLVHESAHRGLNIRDVGGVYGSAAARSFARSNPSSTMSSPENVTMALGFTRDDIR